MHISLFPTCVLAGHLLVRTTQGIVFLKRSLTCSNNVCRRDSQVSVHTSSSARRVHTPESHSESLYGRTEDQEGQDHYSKVDRDDSSHASLLPVTPKMSSRTRSTAYAVLKTGAGIANRSSDACTILKGVTEGIIALMGQYDVSTNLVVSGSPNFVHWV
jgi:hypothetical protein